ANCFSSFKTLPKVLFSSGETVLNSSNNSLIIPFETKNFNRKLSTSAADAGVNCSTSFVYCAILSCNIIVKDTAKNKLLEKGYSKNLLAQLKMEDRHLPHFL